MILSKIIYELRYRNGPERSPNDYIKVFGFNFLAGEYKNPITNQSFDGFQDNDSTLQKLIEPFQESRVLAVINIYSLTNGTFASKEEELFMRVEGDDKESYFFHANELNTHFRWIVVSQTFYTGLVKSKSKQNAVMRCIEQMKLEHQCEGINLEFKLFSVTTLEHPPSKQRIVEMALIDHWPFDENPLHEHGAICGIEPFNFEYTVLDGDSETTQIIPSFTIPGLGERIQGNESMGNHQIPTIDVYSLEGPEIEALSNEIQVILNTQNYTETSKANYSYVGSGDNVLLLIIPRTIVNKLLKYKNLKQISYGIDVKLVSCSTVYRNNRIEATIRHFLITYGKSTGPTSAYVTVFGFGQFEMNQYGYPTFVDEVHAPFATYRNPALTHFFQNIEAYNSNSILYEIEVECVAHPLYPLRKAPWKHGTDHKQGPHSVYIYSLADEIREVEEGDYIPIEFGKKRNIPIGNNTAYRLADSQPNERYLLIMVPMGVLKILLRKPKNVTQKPKRHQLFEFVKLGLEWHTVGMNLKVSLFAWSGISRYSKKMFANLLNGFLAMHARSNGRDPKSYITIFGYEPFDVDHHFDKYENKELTRFFKNINDDDDEIDVSKATGVNWPLQSARSQLSSVEPPTKRRKRNP